MDEVFRRLGHFFIGNNKGIQGEVNLQAPNMAVFHCLCQGLRGKVLGALAGVEVSHAQVYRIGAVLHRRTKGLHRPGGSQ